MGNAASHHSDPNAPRSNSSPSASGISSTVRDRSASLSAAFPSSPIKAILSSHHSSAPSHPSTPPGLIDGGHFTPQGPYAIKGPSTWDYSPKAIRDFIVEKKLAPFYRGLEDYEEEWAEEEVVAGLREARLAQIQQGHAVKAEEASNPPAVTSSTLSSSLAATTSKLKGSQTSDDWPIGGVTMPTSGKITEKERKEARAYKGSVECPICFLYYPPNINTSRCCEQPICTECFVQIKRAEATVTHLESEPAACPYCMEPDFGVIYEATKIARPEVIVASPASEDVPDPRAKGETMRRKSVNAKSKEVVTIDHIRPDWEEKLNAVKAAAARRASRRIIMHRVGDRLIPVGYTSSRNAAAATADGGSGPITMPVDDAAIDALMGSRSGRRARRNTSADAGNGGVPGANELEELMIMEAMRLSMIDHEEQQKKAAEEKKKKDEKKRQGSLGLGTSTQGAGSSSSSTSGVGPSGSANPEFSPRTTSALSEAASTSFIQPSRPSGPRPGDLIDLSSTTQVPQLKDVSPRSGSPAS